MTDRADRFPLASCGKEMLVWVNILIYVKGDGLPEATQATLRAFVRGSGETSSTTGDPVNALRETVDLTSSRRGRLRPEIGDSAGSFGPGV